MRYRKREWERQNEWGTGGQGDWGTGREGKRRRRGREGERERERGREGERQGGSFLFFGSKPYMYKCIYT